MDIIRRRERDTMDKTRKQKMLVVVFLFMVAVLVGGCGHKSNEKITDIEQFKCQSSIQNVFNVLGETEIEKSSYNDGEFYKYKDLNLWGHIGEAVFSVREDKETIQEFYCYLTLNEKELEELLSYFSEKYGSYKVSDYLKTGNNTYSWEIEREKVKDIGYNEIHIQCNGDDEYIIFFKDEWSMKTDEAYYEYLNEGEGSEDYLEKEEKKRK